MNSSSAPSILPGLRFDVVDLVGKPGTQRLVERSVPAPGAEEIPAAMWMADGDPIDVDVSLESVVEGVYASGTARARVEGECSRCLDPLEADLAVRFGDLFTYPQRVPRELSDQERAELLMVEDDSVDLGPLVHDALVLAIEPIPLCSDDCAGLCGECGFRMEQDPTHEHVVYDDRFAALQGFFGSEQGGGSAPEAGSAEGGR